MDHPEVPGRGRGQPGRGHALIPPADLTLWTPLTHPCPLVSTQHLAWTDLFSGPVLCLRGSQDRPFMTGILSLNSLLKNPSTVSS